MLPAFVFLATYQNNRHQNKKNRHMAATYSPAGTPRSTIGAGGLNCRVRHGSGCFPSAMATMCLFQAFYSKTTRERGKFIRTRPRCISTGQLHPSRGFHLRPIYPVIYRTPYLAYPVGGLILREASRLDAFSGYTFRT